MAKRRRQRQEVAPFAATIERISHDGRGICQKEGKVHFVFGALPGETVTVVTQNSRSKFAEGSASEITSNPHPARIDPPCPYFGNCGGCSMQHANIDFQREHKRQTLEELLQHAITQSSEAQKHKIFTLPPVRIVASGEAFGYRRRARLSVKHVFKKETVMVGFRERGGRLVADISACPVLVPKAGELIQELRDFLIQCDSKHETPQIEVAVADQGVALVVRHLQPLSDQDQAAWLEFAEQKNIILYLQPKGYDSVHQVYPLEPVTLTYTVENPHLEFAFQPTQFIQVNAELNQAMIHQALQWLQLSEKDTVLDLFCGLGNFSLPLATQAKHVLGIEGEEIAVQQARINAERNALNNTSFAVCDLSDAEATLKSADQTFDAILIDPPRCGAENILPLLSRWSPSRIVMISCNPATMARDLPIILAQGFECKDIGIVDMFPQTAHVECMAFFTRKCADDTSKSK